MTLYSRLRDLYLTADRTQAANRSRVWIQVPEEEFRALVWQAAQVEGKDRERMPYETGDDYKERIGNG